MKKETKKGYGVHTCPECGGVLIKRNGCKVCMQCGYEACSL